MKALNSLICHPISRQSCILENVGKYLDPHRMTMSNGPGQRGKRKHQKFVFVIVLPCAVQLFHAYGACLRWANCPTKQLSDKDRLLGGLKTKVKAQGLLQSRKNGTHKS